jgi:type VI secretion system secreted protein VgrG
MNATTTPTIDVDLELTTDHRAEIVRLRLSEGMSEITCARVEVASADDIASEELLQSPARVRILRDGTDQRSWDLLVGRILSRGEEGGLLRYELELYPRLWFLRNTRDTRKFRKITTREIVTRVLDRRGVRHRWCIARDTSHRNFVTQYLESDLDFVLRQLELEGIYFCFDADGTMVLSDHSPSAAHVSGRLRTFELLESAGGGLMHDTVAIHELCHCMSIASGRVTLNDYDWKNPQLPLLQSAAADLCLDDQLEVYESPAGYRKPEDGAFLAEVRLQALRKNTDRIEGRSNAAMFEAGRRFELSAGEQLDGEYLLTHVEHRVERHGFADDQGDVGYLNTFAAIPSQVLFRPDARAPRPTIAGAHTAMVVGPPGEEIHTDEHGRFKVKFHWDREATVTDDDSRWIRLCQESASSMSLARVGWEMSLGYIDGDPDRPIGLARHINGAMPPTYPLPQHKSVMSIRTPSYRGSGYNELRLDDAKEAMSFDLKAQRDLRVSAKRNKSETVGNDETRVCTGTVLSTVGGNQQRSIGGNMMLQCLSDARARVEGARSVTIGGDETVKTGDGAKLTIGGDDTELVSSLRLTLAGNVQLPNPIQASKAAIPTPAKIAQAVVGNGSTALDGATGGALSGVKRIVGDASAVGDSLRQLAGAEGGAAAELAAGADAVRAFAENSDPDALGRALDAIRQNGGIAGITDASIEGAVASVESLAPDPRTLLDQATGGLASAGSVGEVLDRLLTGQIARSAGTELQQLAAGARIVTAAQGGIQATWGAISSETVGGAKITIAQLDVATTVAGPCSISVGAALRRVANRDVSYAARESKLTVGGDARIESKKSISVRAPQIRLTATNELSLAAADSVAITLTSKGVHVRGDVVKDGAETCVVRGGPLNVTGEKE